ncbi:MAG: magnesium/cobalt transporter CorA [Promethearchaeota archaeon]
MKSKFKRNVRILKKHNVGEPPGTLIYTGKKKDLKTTIKIIDYNKEHYSQMVLATLDKNLSSFDKSRFRWIHIIGLSDVKLIEDIGNQFNLHHLLLEDILNTNQRPKLENYGLYLFVVLKYVSYNEDIKSFETEQVCLILGENYVISVQDHENDIFTPILDRIKFSKGRIREMGIDYLFYSLIDFVIDNYFTILEIITELIENTEDKIIQNPEPETLKLIYSLKRTMIDFRNSIWPTRELINKLQRENSKLISKDLEIYLRDVNDNVFIVSDLLETQRDILFGMLDMYLSSVNNRMNDIMKILTIISTIFIPLSFLVSLYGMNFKYMPELSFPLAYPILLFTMIIIGIIMILFFRKKKWF